jgi:hypothetical protein
MRPSKLMFPLVVCAGILAMPSRAAATAITVIEEGDGIPTLITDDVGVDTLFKENEFVDLAGFVGPLGSTSLPFPIPIGERAVILTEPSADPFGPRDSDVVILDVGPVSANQLQHFDFIFASDGAPAFDRILSDAILAGAVRVPEDGSLQALELLLDSVPLAVRVQSDFSSSEVPEPGTCFVLASGLAGLVARGWRRRRVGDAAR